MSERKDPDHNLFQILNLLKKKHLVIDIHILPLHVRGGQDRDHNLENMPRNLGQDIPRDFYNDFLDRTFLPFLIQVRNQHFDPQQDLDFCNEFVHHVITFAHARRNVPYYIYKTFNTLPFFEFMMFIHLDSFLIQLAQEEWSTRKEKQCELFLKKFKLCPLQF